MRTSWGQRNDQLLVAKIDDLGSTIYIGYGAPDSQTNEAVWKIKKLTTVGTVTSVQWCDGNDLFDNVWDDRVSLTYK